MVRKVRVGAEEPDTETMHSATNNSPLSLPSGNLTKKIELKKQENKGGFKHKNRDQKETDVTEDTCTL